MAVTVQYIALRMLKYIGIRQLAPEATNSQLESVQPGDLDDVITAINGAMQEVFSAAPDEMREQRLGDVVRGPFQTTLNATQYSRTISAVAGYQSYHQGCTIRLAGDQQDNELVNATTLARAFMGPSGTGISATIFGDCITLDPSVDSMNDPVELPNQAPLYKANDRLDFLRWQGVPLVADAGGFSNSIPFFFFYQKTIARPRCWFGESWFDPTTGPVKRIRLGPLPDTFYPVAYRVALNPPTYVSTDIDNGDHTTDPNKIIPVTNKWVESLLLPAALQRFTAHPAFKNESAKKEIERQYAMALKILSDSTVSPNSPASIRYI